MAKRTFVSSDLHLGHAGILSFTDRPFKDVSSMNEGILKEVNKKVCKDDTLILLGDSVWSTEQHSILERINCNLIIVIGNHDANRHKFSKLSNVLFVCEEFKLKLAGETVVFSHYPYAHKGFEKLKSKILGRKNKFHRPIDHGLFLFHGHVHRGEIVRGRQFNVCWDLHGKILNIKDLEVFVNRTKQKEMSLKDQLLLTLFKVQYAYSEFYSAVLF